MTAAEVGFDIPFGRIAGLRSGNAKGPKVLALHGWLDNAASFLPLAGHFPDLDLVMLDLPGHGLSAHLAAGADYNLLVTVNAILDVADALGWERFAVLGHSMGAGIGSILAASLPQRVTRLVAIEALGALAEAPERTTTRLREAVAAARALASKKLRVFPDLAAPIRARMQANQLSEPSARLLVERGVVAVAGGLAVPPFSGTVRANHQMPVATRTAASKVTSSPTQRPWRRGWCMWRGMCSLPGLKLLAVVGA